MTDSVKNEIKSATLDVIQSVVTGKKWYASKTFWVNIIAAGALLVQGKYGFIVSPEMQALVLSGVNMALRAVTKEAITF
jgi:hypothetical protein